tara:strand:- start:80 stop:475 length:396 start_codon:yes stop_codon:yes gene_type:complete
MNNILIFGAAFLLIFTSCATSVKKIDMPVYRYGESDFNFDSPRDLSFSLKPMPGNSGKLYLNCASESIQNAVVPVGADLTTYLDIIFPNNDSFKHGKVIDETNKTEVPFYSIVLKQETIFSVRALRVGKLK